MGRKIVGHLKHSQLDLAALKKFYQLKKKGYVATLRLTPRRSLRAKSGRLQVMSPQNSIFMTARSPRKGVTQNTAWRESVQVDQM